MTIEVFKDDRSKEQLTTHTCIIAGRDRFLSSWGPGKAWGGSTAAWACKPEHAHRVFQWVNDRDDMTHVRTTNHRALWKVRGLVHIYAVDEGHPALGGGW
tara:strand:+ start:974 stop:1273 length:300 start_codon:yes stop_codon:yes gene_type:complete